MSKIIVVGSSNTDMVVHTSHLPVPGETILGGKFLMNHTTQEFSYHIITAVMCELPE